MAANKTLTWILIADGEHARVVVPAARQQFRTISSLDSTTAHRRSADLGTGEPGRSYESANPARHAIEPKTDPHRAAKQDFVRYLADQMNTAATGGEYDHLVLVAPTHALHDLREALGQEAVARLAGTLAKDIVKVADVDLAGHLEAFWHAPAEAA
jgi:protein required for attachment to host cells